VAKVTEYGITADVECWRSIGASIYQSSDGKAIFGGWQHWATDRVILIESAKAAGLTDGAALAHVEAEARRRRESGEANETGRLLASAIHDLARQIGAESAEALIARLPERIRPYVQEVMRCRHCFG
jgi:hypothetical protein